MAKHVVENGPPLVKLVAGLISSHRESDRFGKITVVVPSIYSAIYLRRAVVRHLAGRGAGMFNVGFERIEDVADSLLRLSGALDGMKPMSRIVASEIVRDSLSNSNGMRYLGGNGNDRKYVDSIRSTLQDLERLPEGAGGALTRLARATGSPIHRELITLHSEYEQASSGWITRAGFSKLAAEVAQRDSELLQEVVGTKCFLVLPHAKSDTNMVLWEALSEVESAESLELMVRADSASGITRHTSFYSTMSSVDIPRQLLRNVLSDARQGIQFGDMAVFVPNLGEATRLRDAFREAGVPVAGPEPRGLASKPVGRFVLHLVEAMRRDMSRDSVMTWLTSSRVASPDTGATMPSTRWDHIARSARIVEFGGETDWQRRLGLYRRSLEGRISRYSADPDGDSDSGISAGVGFWEKELEWLDKLEPFVVGLLNDVRDGLVAKSWHGHVKWLRGMLARYLANDDNVASGTLAGYSQVESVLETVAELDTLRHSEEGNAVPFERFGETLSSAIRGVGGGRSSLGRGVLIAEISAGIAASFERVHVMGLSETAYQLGGTDHPLLRDGDRNLLDPSSQNLPTVRVRQEAARLGFEIALDSSATCRLYWNRSNLGDTSDSYPSPWYLERLSLHLGRPVNAESVMAGEDDEIGVEGSLTDGSSLASDAWEPYGAELMSLVKSRTEHDRVSSLGDASALIAAMRSHNARVGASFTAFDGAVGPIDDVLSGISTSAGRLESYATCPYRYFLSEVLGVEGVPESDDEFVLSAMARGEIVHDMLDRYVRMRESSDVDEGSDLLRQVCDDVFDSYEASDFAPPELLWELEQRSLVRRLERWRQGEYDVLGTFSGQSEVEVRFGYGDGANVKFPVRLADGREIQLGIRGRIDRLAFDKTGNALAVMDYKTGSGAGYSDINNDPVDRGTRLQIPLYMKAARALYPDVAPDLLVGFYWFVFVSDQNRQLVPRSEIDWPRVDDRLSEVLSTILQGIRNGEFPANPGNPGFQSSVGENCTYCPYDAACDSGRVSSWQAKRNSMPRRYVTMVEPEAKR